MRSAISLNFFISEETVKNKWKNLRDKFKKECKKIPKSRSGDSGDQASIYTGSWPYFESLIFLRAVVLPKQTEGNILDSANDSEQLSSHDEESTEIELSEETSQTQNVENLIMSQDTQSPTQLDIQSPDPPPISLPSAVVPQKKKKTAISRFQKEQEEFESSLPPKNTKEMPISVKTSRKRNIHERDDIEKEILELEKRKISFLEQQSTMDDDEDLNFFKSLIPHVRQLPSLNKLYFRTQVQNVLMTELSKLHYIPGNASSGAASTTSNTESNTYSVPSPVIINQESGDNRQYPDANFNSNQLTHY